MLDGPYSPYPTHSTATVGEDPHGLLGHLMRALDEVDYGLMLFRRDQTYWHGNHLARVILGRGDRLFLEQGLLKARSSKEQSALQTHFARAGQGHRCMVDIPSVLNNCTDTAIALVPMAHPAEWPGQAVPVLLIACRPALCEPLSLRFFAQTHGLTRTEEAVLGDLVRGLEVEEIAQTRNMAISTVRTHVKQLRQKTHTTSMRELLNKVAVLPPVVSAVRALG